MLLSPLTHAKAMIGSPGDRGQSPSVSFGVQGYVEELPAGFTSAVVLIGRQGIAATQMAWGETVRRYAGTTRLTLDKDILNSKVTYWTDNGGYYCYCNTFRSNPDRRVPMHITIKDLQTYHKSIGLHIDMYHLDSGFWHSAHADGHCDGVTAANWSASEFHWPHVDQIGDGLGAKVWGKPGEVDAVSWQMLYMGLAGSKYKAARPPWAGGENATGNVYGDSTYDVVRPQGGPWPMIDDTFGGQTMGQVHYTHAHKFWDEVMGYGYRTNNLRSVVVDLLQYWFLNFHDRTNNTHRHEVRPKRGQHHTAPKQRYSTAQPCPTQPRIPSNNSSTPCLHPFPQTLASSLPRPGWMATSGPLAVSATAVLASTVSLCESTRRCRRTTWRRRYSTGRRLSPRASGATWMAKIPGARWVPPARSSRRCRSVQSWMCCGHRV